MHIDPWRSCCRDDELTTRVMWTDGPAAAAFVPRGAHVVQVNSYVIHDNWVLLNHAIREAQDNGYFVFEMV